MSFVKEFDPKNETHVTWLKNIDTAMVEMNDLSKSKDLMKIVNENPFGIKMNNPMDWAQSHFHGKFDVSGMPFVLYPAYRHGF